MYVNGLLLYSYPWRPLVDLSEDSTDCIKEERIEWIKALLELFR